LLDAMDGTPSPPAAVREEAPPPWIEALLVCERYAEQKQLTSGRGLPPDQEVRRLLVALADRGGRMTRTALSQRLGVPWVRLAGLVVAIRRLLNVDGLQVLELDDHSETIILNRPLLLQQFELKE
jgi:hypothetical protein